MWFSELQPLFLPAAMFLCCFTINQGQPEVQTPVVPAQLSKLLHSIFYIGNNMNIHITPFLCIDGSSLGSFVCILGILPTLGFVFVDTMYPL